MLREVEDVTDALQKANYRSLTVCYMKSPVDDDATIRQIDSLLDRLRDWHKGAAALVLDGDIRERANGTLLNIDYAMAHLNASRSDKEQKLKSLS